MTSLALFLLGPPRLERDGVPLQFDTRKILALVAYLAVSGRQAAGSEANGGRFHSRESLLALLWPELEPSRARAVLRRNLSLLRSALEGEWLIADRQTVGTDPEADFWLDVDQFSRLATTWQTHEHPDGQLCPRCLADLEEAAALYRGDFLEGFGLRDSLAYDDWQFFQAEELRQQLASVLERLVGGYGDHDRHAAALPHARRWLALDPLHELAHRALMRLYARTGHRSAALRQYAECVRILEEELGLPPAEETTALYEQIRTMQPLPEAATLADRTAPARHNLPAQTTTFVGREEELAEISARLQDPACRLLTLLGPGGIGKTRLALRLAEELAGAQPAAFEHGIFFVPLAPFRTAEGVVPAVAEALGYSFHTDSEGSTTDTPRQQILDYFRRKQLLLVMDNYEHLLEDGSPQDGYEQGNGTGFVTDLLAAAPGVKVLVTSRASLKVQGEHLYPLTGLRVPEATVSLPGEDSRSLRGFAAIELFLQGARQARPDFELRHLDAEHVIRICRLVQGMPLGILLAAAWVEMLPPEEIAAEIEQSLDFLESDLRDLPDRQRSLRAVFDHSWRLLDEREQEIFQALSVFLGGFNREAALEVVGASLRDLMSLVNKSLLMAPTPGRYDLHELLRQYAVDRLDGAPEQAVAVRDHHCAFYCSALERWAGELKGERQREAMEEMDLEVENARAAWYWALDHQQVNRLAQGVDGMWLYHTWRLRYEEAEAALGAAARGLEQLQAAEAQRLRARLSIMWSFYQLELGRTPESLETARRGEELLHRLERAGHDVRHELALAAFHRARRQFYGQDILGAQETYTQSVTLYEQTGDRWGQARALAYLGWLAEHLGDYGQAQELCERSLAIQDELGDRRGLAGTTLNLGVISWVQGRLEEADRLLRQSMSISWELDDWNRVAHAMKGVGEVLVRSGQFDPGLVLLECSLEIYDDLGHRYGRQGLVPFLGETKAHLGRYAEARADAQLGVELSRRAGHRWGVAFSQFVEGMAALAEGAAQEALALFQKAVAVFEEVRHPENRGWVGGPLGLAARQAGETALARRSVVEALQIGADLGAFMPVLYALPAAALLLADRGAAERAVEVYACASRYGFVADSCWFEALTAGPVAEAAALLPARVVGAARARGEAQDWDTMAAGLLAEL
jgi:predicted ATPase/DNA-binding SARP family transcriptional activator